MGDCRDSALDFLGFTDLWVGAQDGRDRLLFGPKRAVIDRFMDKVRILTRRTRPMNLYKIMNDLAPVVRG